MSWVASSALGVDAQEFIEDNMRKYTRRYKKAKDEWYFQIEQEPWLPHKPTKKGTPACGPSTLPSGPRPTGARSKRGSTYAF